MGQSYELTVEAVGLSGEQIRTFLNKWYADDYRITQGDDGITRVTCALSMSGSWSEEEAHNELYAELRMINPKAHIRTFWMIIEPSEFFGDDDLEEVAKAHSEQSS